MLLDLIQHVASALIVTLITVLIGFLYRLNHQLDKLENVFSTLAARAESHEKKLSGIEDRLEVHDDFFTDLAGESVDSRRIAEGLDERIVFKCKKYKDCP